MGVQTVHPSTEIWRLVRQQHGVVSRQQLLDAGLTGHAVDHRLATGRLHVVWRGVFAVGRPQLTREGLFMAAVLACGEGAALSHASAAELWAIRRAHAGPLEVSVPAGRNPRRRGIRTHRRTSVKTTRHKGISVTSAVQTLIDMSPRLHAIQLERALNEAVNRDLTDPDRLRAAVADIPGPLRTMLERDAFTLTDSELEQLFLPIARAAGLPEPLTQAHVNGYRVDFYWPDLRLVVEADSLRFHRTPAQQRRDTERDQAHAMAGLLPLRFTHAQIAYEPRHVRRVLEAVRARAAS
jgi:very-short-patch-repair endonuclease